MQANRRQTLALLTSLGVGHSSAQAGYPNKPVRVVIGFPAGTTGDVVMRIKDELMSAPYVHMTMNLMKKVSLYEKLS